MEANAFITFLFIVCGFVVSVFIGLALGNIFARQRVKKESVCDFVACNEQLVKWVNDQQGDLDSSSAKISQCASCPERAYSQITNEIKKYGMWKAYKTKEEASQAITI